MLLKKFSYTFKNLLFLSCVGMCAAHNLMAPPRDNPPDLIQNLIQSIGYYVPNSTGVGKDLSSSDIMNDQGRVPFPTAKEREEFKEQDPFRDAWSVYEDNKQKISKMIKQRSCAGGARSRSSMKELMRLTFKNNQLRDCVSLEARADGKNKQHNAEVALEQLERDLRLLGRSTKINEGLRIETLNKVLNEMLGVTPKEGSLGVVLINYLSKNSINDAYQDARTFLEKKIRQGKEDLERITKNSEEEQRIALCNVKKLAGALQNLNSKIGEKRLNASKESEFQSALNKKDWKGENEFLNNETNILKEENKELKAKNEAAVAALQKENEALKEKHAAEVAALQEDNKELNANHAAAVAALQKENEALKTARRKKPQSRKNWVTKSYRIVASFMGYVFG